MNRLRDYAGNDPLSERGIDMLRETPATEVAAELKRRVWSSLQERQAQESVGLRLSSVKVLAMGVTIFSLAGTAGAVITGRWIVPAIDRARSAATAQTVRPERRRAVRRVAVAPAHEETPAPPEAPATAAARPVERVAQRPSVGSRHTASAATQERTQVLDALVALRRDHDPVRAGALLDHYLIAHPRGVLREEALVLATEAADARGDHDQARRFARSYQSEYPEGRFRQFARNHTQSSPAQVPAEAVPLNH